MRFVALDVETANSNRSSICQVGMCLFEDGEETDSFATYINPGCHFDDMNVNVHGISDDEVLTSPSFLAILGTLHAFMRNSVVITHGLFDRQAIAAACLSVGAAAPDSIWIDSVDLARRAWPSLPNHRLDTVAHKIGVQFDHHDALHDARAAGLVALAAFQAIGRPFGEMVQAFGRRVYATEQHSKGVTSPRAPFIAKKAILARDHIGGDGPLAGQRIVFTGALTMPRDEAARIAATLGAHCSDSVSKKTTILVVGDADLPRSQPSQTPGIMFTTFVRSGKHTKAEALNEAGAAIRIIGESEFRVICETAQAEPLSPKAALAKAMNDSDYDGAAVALIAQAKLLGATDLAASLKASEKSVSATLRTLTNLARQLYVKIGI